MCEIDKAIKDLQEESYYACKREGCPKDLYLSFDLAVQALEEKKQREWVKCSERLPTKEEWLLNDSRFIVTDGNRIYEDSFDMYADGYTQPKWMYSYTQCQPIAWQPLPQPYKEVENE